jgi:hypothetical protein
MKSILTKNQKRKFEREMVIDGEPAKMIVTIRYDDECNNGHNSFAITAHLYDRGCIRGEAFTTLSTGKKRWLGSCGCLHEEIAKYFPELQKYIKWHLCDSGEPMSYIENSMYWHGKRNAPETNFENFKSTAIWPDAPLSVMKLSEKEITDKLNERLPGLMQEFRAAVKELGFVY